jgi:ribonuclease BN (tRNA processing enzyme)
MKRNFITLCTEPETVHTLIFDGQFTEDEYKRRRSWGHSSTDDAVHLAENLGVRQLVVTHHSPSHDDAALAGIEENLQRTMASSRLARQGPTYTARG